MKLYQLYQYYIDIRMYKCGWLEFYVTPLVVRLRKMASTTSCSVRVQLQYYFQCLFTGIKMLLNGTEITTILVD